MTHLVRPSVRPMACARPLAAQGNWATSTAIPRDLASVSVSPAQAISGSVKTTAGMACGSNADGFAREPLDCGLALVAGLVRQHRLAGHVADGQDVRVGGAPLEIDGEEALASTSTAVFSSPRPALLGRRPTLNSTRLNRWTAPALAASNVTSIASCLSASEATFALR